MSEMFPSPSDAQPETLPEALEGRFASLVRIMGGRFSIRSRLGILELENSLVSLRTKSGDSLFSVPVATVEARPHRRRLALYQYYFQVRAADRWWYLCAYGQTKYKRASTRALEERYRLRALAPRPANMSMDDYGRVTRHAVKHQVLWAACWVNGLNFASACASAS